MNPLKYWKPDTFEISSYKYSLKERVNQTYTTSGNDNTNLCTYTYNELGFRGDSVKKEGFRVMSLGCSITEGVGVNDDETWPAQFCSHIENGVNLNFGTGGRSNDFICRCLMSYYDLIKPDLVLILYTFPPRREIYTDNNEIEPYIPTKVWGKLLETEEGRIIQNSMDTLQNDNSDFINWYKNHMLIKLFLALFVILGLYFFSCYISLKRKEKEVEQNRDNLFDSTDKRFSIFQNIVEEFSNPAEYELTFLNEIIKIRSQSQKYINENKFRESISNELKINKITESIDKLFEETQHFEIISDEKKKEYANSLKNLNKEIEEKTKSYNDFVQKYNKTKVSSYFGLFMLLFNRLFQKADLFNIK